LSGKLSRLQTKQTLDDFFFYHSELQRRAGQGAGVFASVQRSLKLETDIFSGEWSDKVLGIKGSPNVMGPGCTMASLCLL